MNWFWFALIALICWSGSDLFSKIGCCGEKDKTAHLKMVVAVGLVMGLHAAYMIVFHHVSVTWDVVWTYLPVSLLYILSMTLGYVGLRYIELSISSPICNSSGALVAVLCLCRFVQGIGLGGEWSGAALVATENAPEDKRALYGSFPELGAPIGFFLSNGTYFLLETFNDNDAMLAWGWRVPFLLSSILVIVGLVVRVQMEETPIFRMAQEQKKVVKSPLTEVFKKSWKEVIQATFLVAVTYTLFYTLATWSLAWGTKTVEQGGGNLGFTNQEYLLMLMIAVCVFAAFIVISCVNADKFGRKRVIIISSCCLIAFALLFPFLLDPAVVGQRNFATNLLFLCIGFALMGTAFGPIGAFLPELFDANVRYSGSGIGYNLAAIVGAAFVPTIATWLSHHWGVHSVGLYLGVMALCCLIAVLSCKETKNVDFTK